MLNFCRSVYIFSRSYRCAYLFWILNVFIARNLILLNFKEVIWILPINVHFYNTSKFLLANIFFKCMGDTSSFCASNMWYKMYTYPTTTGQNYVQSDLLSKYTMYLHHFIVPIPSHYLTIAPPFSINFSNDNNSHIIFIATCDLGSFPRPNEHRGPTC